MPSGGGSSLRRSGRARKFEAIQLQIIVLAKLPWRLVGDLRQGMEERHEAQVTHPLYQTPDERAVGRHPLKSRMKAHMPERGVLVWADLKQSTFGEKRRYPKSPTRAGFLALVAGD
jgi:hypothetical protein